MASSPNKEMISFFTQCLSMGFVLLIIVGLVILKGLEVLGIIKVNLWN
jgi:hypothetical protein